VPGDEENPVVETVPEPEPEPTPEPEPDQTLTALQADVSALRGQVDALSTTVSELQNTVGNAALATLLDIVREAQEEERQPERTNWLTRKVL
jgi:hypothetical protein